VPLRPVGAGLGAAARPALAAASFLRDDVMSKLASKAAQQKQQVRKQYATGKKNCITHFLQQQQQHQQQQQVVWICAHFVLFLLNFASASGF